MADDEIRAGDCCELCKKHFEGQHGWGRECGGGCKSLLPNDRFYSIAARFCHDCTGNRNTCPQCGALLLRSIL